jgi:adenosylhomocysteine nucleosidase
MKRVAIIAALPGELKPLVRRWEHERRGGVDVWRWRFDEGEWVAACAGAGVGAATRAFAEVEKDGDVSVVVSTGWVGALGEEFEAARIYGVSGVIDARTGERFRSSEPTPKSQNRDMGHPDSVDVSMRQTGVWLVTSPIVADEAEKRRLAGAYGAGLVDMEAAAVARLAAMRGIPFYCVKGVSDGFHDKLPDFNRFISATGQFQLARFILFVLLRPWHWPALVRMGENSKRAAIGLADSLLDILDERGTIRTRNGYPNLKP